MHISITAKIKLCCILTQLSNKSNKLIYQINNQIQKKKQDDFLSHYCFPNPEEEYDFLQSKTSQTRSGEQQRNELQNIKKNGVLKYNDLLLTIRCM